LSFFYEAWEQRAWGFHPKDRGAWAVMFTPPGVDLRRRVHRRNDGRWAPFGTVVLEPSAEMTTPPWDGPAVTRVLVDQDQRFAYASVVESEPGVVHRLLGHPQPIQGDMQTECQLVSHGFYCGDGSGYEHRDAQPLLPGAVDWQLLLQIDSQEDIGMAWGDAGRIYFWIHRDDLARRSWEKTWLILQCC